MKNSLSTVQLEARSEGGFARALLRPGLGCIVGRAPECDLRLGAHGLAERHCSIRHRGDHLELIDMRGEPGVSIGSARVERALVPLTATFQLGGAEIVARSGKAKEVALLPRMVGNSPPMRELASLVERCGPLSMPVMVLGESGSGKELVARAVHALSPRRTCPFVALNAGTLAPAMATPTLFGHERGAFTGATECRRGAFRAAHGGTLFIDELGALPSEAQASLLRVVEDGVVVAVGADSGVEVDVRLVAATCEPLQARVAAGTFRADLLERLSGCIVRVPPLRERRQDVALLAEYLASELELPVRLAPDALGALSDYPFPGNVRELRNILSQAAMLGSGGVIHASDIEAALDVRRPAHVPSLLSPDRAQALVREHYGNVSAAARAARLPRSTFRDRLRKCRGPQRRCAAATGAG